MKYLQTGNFFGQTNRTISFEGITLTDTEYTHDYVDWHYHENAYFTFILEGQVIEGNKKEKLHCPAGTLLFHCWQDPHYNIKPRGYTRGFHVEIERSWFERFSLKELQGSFRIDHPDIKLIFHRLLSESLINDKEQELSVFSNLVQVLSSMLNLIQEDSGKNPFWVRKARELIHETVLTNMTLSDLATELNIHPVHLCRQFPKYFKCNFGEYVRRLKVEKALTLLHNPEFPLTEIAIDCGFSDQSHFIRCFKEITNDTPLQYRKTIFGRRSQLKAPHR